MARISAAQAGHVNVLAFLDMIAWSEGTSRVAGSDDGYNVLVGGGLFHSYADHPRQLVKVNPKLSSTAAGRYQLLARYWDAYRALLGLHDFSPVSQDMVAFQQLREQRAVEPLIAGNFALAVQRCANIWASLPGAGYGQHENKLPQLLVAYQRAGGMLA